VAQKVAASMDPGTMAVAWAAGMVKVR